MLAQQRNLLRNERERPLAAACIHGDGDVVAGQVFAQVAQQRQQQGRGQIVHAVVARIFQRVQGNGFARARQAADHDQAQIAQRG